MSRAESGRLRAGVSPTERTLAEQLQITEREIQSRKDLLRFCHEDEIILTGLQEKVAQNLDTIVNTFYDWQLQSREISLVIGDSETLQRLRTSMRGYIVELFDGYYGAEYVNKRLRIGKIHQRIGVSPRLYVAAITELQTILVNTLIKPHVAEIGRDVSEGQRNALRRLLMFDMQFVFDTYISTLVAEVDTARTELEEYAEGLEDMIAKRTEELRQISTRDSLTGAYNQRGFREHLHRELAVAERKRAVLSLIYFDVNAFKALNDHGGHLEGDRILRLIGKTLLATVRQVDFACRYGGDEFCVILPDTPADTAHTMFTRFIKAFEAECDDGVTFSAGIAETGPTNFAPLDELIKLADSLMYQAKDQCLDTPGHYIKASGDVVADIQNIRIA